MVICQLAKQRKVAHFMTRWTSAGETSHEPEIVESIGLGELVISIERRQEDLTLNMYGATTTTTNTIISVERRGETLFRKQFNGRIGRGAIIRAIGEKDHYLLLSLSGKRYVFADSNALVDFDKTIALDVGTGKYWDDSDSESTLPRGAAHGLRWFRRWGCLGPFLACCSVIIACLAVWRMWETSILLKCMATPFVLIFTIILLMLTSRLWRNLFSLSLDRVIVIRKL